MSPVGELVHLYADAFAVDDLEHFFHKVGVEVELRGQLKAVVHDGVPTVGLIDSHLAFAFDVGYLA